MKESVRVFRFIIVGTMNAVIIALVVWVMMHLLGEGYILANVIAYVLAQTHNFIGSKYWVFAADQGQRSKVQAQIAFFLAAFGLAYGSQFVFLLMLVELLHVNEYLAQFLGLFVYGAVNYCCNRYITFRAKKS